MASVSRPLENYSDDVTNLSLSSGSRHRVRHRRETKSIYSELPNQHRRREAVHVEVLLLGEEREVVGPRPPVVQAHPEASSDLELVQSLWIQEVPKK